MDKYKENAEKIKRVWAASTGAMSDIIGDLVPGAKNTFDRITSVVDAWSQGVIEGIASTVSNVIGFFKDLFETAERRAEMSKELHVQYMEDVALKRAEMNQKRLEDEKKAALEELEIAEELALKRFELTAENYDNMTDSAKAYYDLLQEKETEKFNKMTEDEKQEYLIKKKFTDEKAKIEKKFADDRVKIENEYTEKIRQSQVRQARIQLKIALARVESDRSEAEARINKEYWAPWDKKKKDAEWRKMQGIYNDIRSDLENELSNLQGLQRGGVIGGFGGGDKVPATLEKGEAVLPKEWQINPFPFFNQLLSMRDQTRGINSNITNMNNQKEISFEGANFYFQGANAKEVIDEIQEIAENTGSRVFVNAT